jgi:MFS family permease
MQHRSLGALGPSVASFRTALADRDLARLLGAWLSVMAGRSAFLVVTLVIAYELGGAPAVGLMGLVRYLIPMLLAPLAGLPTARWRPDLVLVTTNAIRTFAVAIAALTIALDAPIALLFLAIALEAAAGAFTRPLHAALLPCVARTPEELVAANVTSSAAEGLGTFVGPAIAGFLLVVSGPLGATLAVLAIYAIGLVPIARLAVHVPRRSDGSVRAATAQIVAGARAAARFAGPRLILVAVAAQTFVRGLLTVLTVVAAIELLGMGDGGVGALTAAIGIGGLIGAIGAITLAGRPRMTPAMTVGLVGWGLPIAVIGLVATPAVALAAMVAIGISNSILDVAAFTLAQRTTPNESRVAFLGLIDTAANGGVAAGGVAAPFLIEWVGISAALVVAGAILPVTAALLWPFLRRVPEDGHVDQRCTALLRGVPLFTPLSLATLEHLAGSMEPASFAAGEAIMREGEHGDRYVIVERGAAVVSQGGTEVRTLGHGDAVGEIALLRDVPRTATVVATAPVDAFVLDRDSFLEAVTGTPRSLVVATDVVSAHLGRDAGSQAETAG